MAAYHRVDDLRSPAGWLPVHRDQLRAERSVSSIGNPLPFTFYHSCLPISALNVRESPEFPRVIGNRGPGTADDVRFQTGGRNKTVSRMRIKNVQYSRYLWPNRRCFRALRK